MQTLTIQEKEQKERELGAVPFHKQVKGTGFSERLRKMIGNKSGRAFAKEVGISYSTLHNYLTNVSSPTLDNLIALAEATGVDMKWLATGEEEQPKTVMERVVEKAKSVLDDLVTMIASYSSINVSAGFGSFNEGVTEPDGEEPYSDSLLQSLRVNPERCAVFWANGDSMEPTIADGDQLLVDLTKTEAKGGDKIYLVQNGDSVWVKRVRMKWGVGIELISDNREEYEPIIIPQDEAEYLQIIGQVVHIGKSLV